MKSKEGRTAWDRPFGKEFHGKLLPVGPKVIYRRPKNDAAKFAPSGSDGIMLGHHFEPDVLFKGDCLVLSLDNLFVEERPKSTIHRVKEVVRALAPNTYPRRDAKNAKRERAAKNIVEDGIHKEPELEVDVEAPTMEIENMERPLAVEKKMIVERGALQRIPRASRIYMPRDGSPSRPPVPDGPLDDSVGIEFKIENPKRPSSRSHEVYELYKMVKTIGEARRLGASTGHIMYDLSKGHAKLLGALAVVCFAPYCTYIVRLREAGPRGCAGGAATGSMVRPAIPSLRSWQELRPRGHPGHRTKRPLPSIDYEAVFQEHQACD